jgi:hypothetical protein
MFEVGDMVRFKPSGIVMSRYNPNKRLGIITYIERNMFLSYNGTREDLVEVFWMPWGKRERMMEFYLEPLVEE